MELLSEQQPLCVLALSRAFHFSAWDYIDLSCATPDEVGVSVL